MKLEMLESIVKMARDHFHWEGGIPKQVEFRDVKNHHKYHEDLLEIPRGPAGSCMCLQNLCRDMKEARPYPCLL